MPATPTSASPRVSTGVPELDTILGGGLTGNRSYLLEGTPGSGKTTIALQFLLEGVSAGEPGLYITLSETAAELREVGRSHGWTLEGIELFELVSEDGLDPDSEQSILDPSEVELGETIAGVMECVDRLRPARVVFDSLSEMRLLAQNSLRYRRQILALKQYFSTRQCTVLLLDDRSSDPGDLQLHSIAHGVITLEQAAQEYGSERRRLRVVKMRGVKYRGGFHDFAIETGGVSVFPRLVAADHHAEFSDALVSTGIAHLDEMLGGGLSPGTNTLLNGPSGVGKTTTAVCCGLEAIRRGEKAAYYLFDEGVTTMLARSKAMGMDLQPHIRKVTSAGAESHPGQPGHPATRPAPCLATAASTDARNGASARRSNWLLRPRSSTGTSSSDGSAPGTSPSAVNDPVTASLIATPRGRRPQTPQPRRHRRHLARSRSRHYDSHRRSVYERSRFYG